MAQRFYNYYQKTMSFEVVIKDDAIVIVDHTYNPVNEFYWIPFCDYKRNTGEWSEHLKEKRWCHDLLLKEIERLCDDWQEQGKTNNPLDILTMISEREN